MAEVTYFERNGKVITDEGGISLIEIFDNLGVDVDFDSWINSKYSASDLYYKSMYLSERGIPLLFMAIEDEFEEYLINNLDNYGITCWIEEI